MNEELRETIIDGFTDVIEKMAFMFIEEAEEDEMDADGALVATMSFTGDHSGSLTLALSPATANELASNVIGVDDALRELLNVTCGNLLTGHYGEEPVFDLSVPKVESIDASAWRNLVKAPDAIALLIDDNPAVIQFKTK